MTASNQPICIIPARGGSKRFPRKNIAPLGGKPLLAWTIDAAKVSELFDKVYVSSDDAEILDIAERHRATPHKRSATLADDRTGVAEVCATICDELTNGHDANQPVVALLPTSPFRSAATIRNAYEQFINRNGQSLQSIAPLEHPPEWAMNVVDGNLQPREPKVYDTPRKELPQSVRGDGLVMIARRGFLETHRSFLGPDTLAFASPPNETVDIDEPRDLLWAEFLLSNQEAEL